MAVQGREHVRGWREAFEVDGEPFVVEARHHVHRRLPGGHEIARQRMAGKPCSMVEVTSHEWAVTSGRRMVGTLRQHPSGIFHDGRRDYRGSTVAEAAASLVRASRRRPAPTDGTGGPPGP